MEKPGTGRRLLTAAALTALLSTAGVAESLAQAKAGLEEIARSYVEILFGDDLSALAGFHDAAMKAQMTVPQMEQIRAGLTAQLGGVATLGEPWVEDSGLGYHRLRVPVEFEKDTIDVRVVIDGDMKVAGLFFVPRVERPSGDQPEAPGEERQVEVGDGDDALPGLLLIPEGDGPFAGVVLVHGSGPHDRDETIGPNKPLRDVAWGLAERGIASLRYDKRSFANPESLAALGDALTVEHEVIRDAREAVRTLAAAAEVEASKIYLLGHSLGGTVVPRIPTTETPVAGMVVLAGMTLPMPEKVIEQTEYIMSLQPKTPEATLQVESLRQQMNTVRRALDGEIEPPAGYLMGVPIGYYADLEAHPPAQLAAKSGRPVLVLQGERDYQVTLGDFALWQQALAGQSFACLKSYPALDHLFHEGEGPSKPDDYAVKKPVAPEVIADVAAWIREGTCRGGDLTARGKAP